MKLNPEAVALLADLANLGKWKGPSTSGNQGYIRISMPYDEEGIEKTGILNSMTYNTCGGVYYVKQFVKPYIRWQVSSQKAVLDILEALFPMIHNGHIKNRIDRVKSIITDNMYIKRKIKVKDTDSPLSRIRKSEGHTLSDYEKLIGVTRGAISQVENGKYCIPKKWKIKKFFMANDGLYEEMVLWFNSKNMKDDPTCKFFEEVKMLGYTNQQIINLLVDTANMSENRVKELMAGATPEYKEYRTLMDLLGIEEVPDLLKYWK